MPTASLTYREPTTGLTLSVEFYGAYEGSWAGTRPRYRYTATWSRESGNVDLQGVDLYGPAEGRQDTHGTQDNLLRVLHTFVDFLTSDAEKYAYADDGGSDGYTFDAAVAERAYGVDGELSELALFLSDREQVTRWVLDDVDSGTLDPQELEAYLAFTHPGSEHMRSMWDRFAHNRLS